MGMTSHVTNSPPNKNQNQKTLLGTGRCVLHQALAPNAWPTATSSAVTVATRGQVSPAQLLPSQNVALELSSCGFARLHHVDPIHFYFKRYFQRKQKGRLRVRVRLHIRLNVYLRCPNTRASALAQHVELKRLRL